MKRHEIFNEFKCWEGYCDSSFTVNFIGVMTRIAHQHCFSVARSSLGKSGRKLVHTDYPLPSESYFEFISILESVVQATEGFTMVELGAGMGTQIVNAGVAVRSYHRQAFPCKLIAVEAEPTHFEWMKQHMLDNDLDPNQHRLIEAAISDKDGVVEFNIGFPEWYGSAIVDAPHFSPAKQAYWRLRKLYAKIFGRKCTLTDYWTGSQATGKYYTREVKAMSLNTLLRSLDLVDLIHSDVQGAELRVFESSIEQVNMKVKKIHIGTHNLDAEGRLRTLFRGMGWNCLYDYPGMNECRTPYGTVKFQDGIQVWRNPRILNIRSS